MRAWLPGVSAARDGGSQALQGCTCGRPRAATPGHPGHGTPTNHSQLNTARDLVGCPSSTQDSETIVAQYVYTMQGVTKTVPPKRVDPRKHLSVLLSRRQDRRAGLERCRQIEPAQDHGRAWIRNSKVRRGRRRTSRSAICPRSHSSTRVSTCAATWSWVSVRSWSGSRITTPSQTSSPSR